MLQHTLAEQLRFNAASFPERPALQVVAGPELTYAEALDRTLVLATAIRERSDGSPVAILHRNGPDAALSFLACQLAGVPAVPVNNVLTPSEMDYLLDDSSVGVLLHGPEFTHLVPALSPARKPAAVCSADLGGPAQPWEAFTASDPAAPFIIGYTSGTTGFPKGAVYDGEGMYVQYLRWAVHFGLDADSTLLTAGPMFHNSYGGLSCWPWRWAPPSSGTRSCRSPSATRWSGPTSRCSTPTARAADRGRPARSGCATSPRSAAT
jgi:acyl-CoA synthetase (AMP-forming)/AMP-acid ligase II